MHCPFHVNSPFPTFGPPSINCLPDQFLLLIAATVLAFQNRRVKSTFNESWYLSFVIYSHFMFTLLRGILYLLRSKFEPHVVSTASSFLISFDVMATLAIYFLPKLAERNEITTTERRAVWNSAPANCTVSAIRRRAQATAITREELRVTAVRGTEVSHDTDKDDQAHVPPDIVERGSEVSPRQQPEQFNVQDNVPEMQEKYEALRKDMTLLQDEHKSLNKKNAEFERLLAARQKDPKDEEEFGYEDFIAFLFGPSQEMPNSGSLA